MATLCTYCGTPLPKDDARYCAKCGMLVPSHPFSAKSVSSPSSPANPTQGTPGRTIVREQIAQQPPSRSSGHSIHDTPPPWISRLDASPVDTSRGGAEQSWRQQNQIPSGKTLAEPASPNQQSNPPARSMNVKVWDEPAVSPVDAGDDRVETLPTRPLTNAPHVPAPRNGNAPSSHGRSPRDLHADQVEHLDTVPLATPSPALNRQTPWPASTPIGQPQTRSQQSNLFAEPASPFPNAAPTMQPRGPQQRSQAAQQVSQPGLSQHPTAQPAAPSVRPASRKKVRMIAIVMLAALVVIGAVAFVIMKHPFSIATVTQPQQTFSSTQFGFSLQYPSGWQSTVNAANSTATFTDSSQTGQFMVLVTANGSNSSQFLQQEASKLGMTNIQTNLPPVSLAGASWQQLKGSVLVKGATYTETLLSVVHGAHLYTIMQLAPQTTYPQEEHIVFSAMRSSFNFV